MQNLCDKRSCKNLHKKFILYFLKTVNELGGGGQLLLVMGPTGGRLQGVVIFELD